MKLFRVKSPAKHKVPIVISVPHAGIQFPAELRKKYKKRMRNFVDDTDWFVHRLYDFAPAMGITLVKANLSRWVIDLNRNPDSEPLYDDGRLITSNTPTTDFFGNKIYKSKKHEPDQKEVERRQTKYYWPYYSFLSELLEERKKEFGKVLLWDAHSIRHRVSTIQEDPFPDMILGNNDEKTAHPSLIKTALDSLRSVEFEVSHNSPFKGGHITRYFGKPDNHIHTLQLEMNKILYMDDNEITYNKGRAKRVQDVLKTCMGNLAEAMNTKL